MAKVFFIASSDDCNSVLNINDTFANSFATVPIIGGIMVKFVGGLGVSGIALLFFFVFVILSQCIRGFSMIYRMSSNNQTYKRSLACLKNASGFASLRCVERMLTDALLEQEVRLKKRVDEEVERKKTGASDYFRTESVGEMAKLSDDVSKVIYAFYWELLTTFGVRIMGENLFIADLQASFLGLMWDELKVKGRALIILSVTLSGLTSLFKITTMVQLIPKGSKDTRMARCVGWIMVVFVMAMVVHIAAKVWAAFECKHHLLNLSQGGCYVPLK